MYLRDTLYIPHVLFNHHSTLRLVALSPFISEQNVDSDSRHMYLTEGNLVSH